MESIAWDHVAWIRLSTLATIPNRAAATICCGNTSGAGGPMTVAVGAVATFDGSSSTSSEARIERYQWRLALRPEASTATLTVVDQEMLTFVADMPGQFKIELRVFDGQLWSSPTSATLTVTEN